MTVTNEALWASRTQKKNYILNGGMTVSQENGLTSSSVNGYYPVDQFFAFNSFAGVLNAAQVASATPSGSPNRIRLTVGTADTSVGASDNGGIIQSIEGYRITDLLFGTSSAKIVVLRFGVRAPAGTYCVAFRNSGAARSYVAEYTISAGEANTDVVKTVVVPGDQAGTWLTNNTLGVQISWCIMSGTTYQTTAGSWTSGNYIASPNQSNLMATVGNVFELFDVGLYQGRVDPGFWVPDYVSELLLCQRYYERTTFAGIFLGGGSFSQIYAPIYWVEKRGSATAVLPASTNLAWTSAGAVTTPSTFSIGISSVKSGYIMVSGSGLGGIIPFNLSLNARM
jgi:hypothetical protein